MTGPILLALRILIALCLYAFLAWAFWTIWRELRQQGMWLAARRIPPIKLTVRATPEHDQSKLFSQAEVFIGRAPDCEFVVENETISARHARLAHHHGQWWLEDLQSTNGTKLNGERLATPTVIVAGDSFECGQVSFTVSLGGDANMDLE
jgi:hypothetical protein